MKNFRMVLILVMFMFSTKLTAQDEQPPGIDWVRYYDSEHMEEEHQGFTDVFRTREGYAMTGWVRCNAAVYTAMWLLVTNRAGNVLIDRIYEDRENNNSCAYGHSIIKTDDGGYLIGGHTQLARGNSRCRFDVLKINNEGELNWWNGYATGSGAACYAVIELKGGNYMAVGADGQWNAYAIRLNNNGEVLWENTYSGMRLSAIREVEGGLLFCGYGSGIGATLIRTNFEGEVIWDRSYDGGDLWDLISCPEGGFAACGGAYWEGGFFLMRTDDDGQLLWSNSYDISEGYDVARGLIRQQDGGFVMVGECEDGGSGSAVMRTDMMGNLRWERTSDQLPPNGRGAAKYQSAIIELDGSTIIVGEDYGPDQINGQWDKDGIMLCLAPDDDRPVILDASPDSAELEVLLHDSLDFSVTAVDNQEDRLDYVWIFAGDTISTDSSATATFEELGDFSVECVVSDGMNNVSAVWTVHVVELSIRAFSPDSLNLCLRRGTEIDFALDIEAIEDLEFTCLWTLTKRDRQQQIIGQEDHVIVEFVLAGDYRLDGLVSYDGGEKQISWGIQVRSTVWWWWPHELELSVPVDTVMDFAVFPFNPESDSMEYRWEFDGELVDEAESEINLNLNETGWHYLTAYATEGLDADTVSWALNVFEEGSVRGGSQYLLPPEEPQLYPPHPNPFNSLLDISFYIPASSMVKMSLYDLKGREVDVLLQQNISTGKHNLTFNAQDLPSGYYFLRFLCAGKVNTEKILLLR